MQNIELPADIPKKKELLDANDRTFGKIHQTPLMTSKQLNDLYDAQFYFKAENFQKAGSFKSRGAVNAVFSLSEEQSAKGVCTHSSGNHAQALAKAAALKGIPAHIVMPETAPKVKVAAVKDYGAQITFCPPTLKDRESTLAKIQNKTGATEIHPYNLPAVIAGQSTLAQEVQKQLETEPDMIITPVGGGGLLSGTALAVHHFFRNTSVYAAEPEGADDAFRSFHNKKFFPSENPNTIADGLLTSLGSRTFPVIMNHVNDIVTVREESIIKAMRFIWERMKIIIEPSSAVPLAAIFEQKIEVKNKTIVLVLSGGNLDLDYLPWQ